MKLNKNIIFGLVIVLVIITGLLFVYQNFRLKSTTGSKTITVEIIDNDKNNTKYTIKTNAEFLKQALEDEPSIKIEGTQGEYGLVVDSINGIKADYLKDRAYWAFFLGDEYCNYGVESQPVNDGDEFKIVYTLSN